MGMISRWIAVWKHIKQQHTNTVEYITFMFEYIKQIKGQALLEIPSQVCFPSSELLHLHHQTWCVVFENYNNSKFALYWYKLSLIIKNSFLFLEVQNQLANTYCCREKCRTCNTLYRSVISTCAILV